MQVFRQQFVIIVVIVPVVILIQGFLVLDVGLHGTLCAVENSLEVSLVPTAGLMVTASATVELFVIRACTSCDAHFHDVRRARSACYPDG